MAAPPAAPPATTASASWPHASGSGRRGSHAAPKQPTAGACRGVGWAAWGAATWLCWFGVRLSLRAALPAGMYCMPARASSPVAWMNWSVVFCCCRYHLGCLPASSWHEARARGVANLRNVSLPATRCMLAAAVCCEAHLVGAGRRTHQMLYRLPCPACPAVAPCPCLTRAGAHAAASGASACAGAATICYVDAAAAPCLQGSCGGWPAGGHRLPGHMALLLTV